MKHYNVGKLNCQDSTATHYLAALLDWSDNSWLDDGTLAKNKWFQNVEQDKFGGTSLDKFHLVKCIRDMQHGRRG